jgi:hypothetical protein
MVRRFYVAHCAIGQDEHTSLLPSIINEERIEADTVDLLGGLGECAACGGPVQPGASTPAGETRYRCGRCWQEPHACPCDPVWLGAHEHPPESRYCPICLREADATGVGELPSGLRSGDRLCTRQSVGPGDGTVILAWGVHRRA